MKLPGRIPLGVVSLLAIAAIVAACGTSGSSSGASSGGPAATLARATVAGASAADGGSSGTGTCAADLTSGHQKFTLGGLEAWHFCGPASASVTLGSSTVQIQGGSCTTTSVGYSVSIGTQLFGNPSPSQEPDLLIILADPTTGVGSISGVASHTHWLLLTEPVVLAADKRSGTFSGATITGAQVHGSFTC